MEEKTKCVDSVAKKLESTDVCKSEGMGKRPQCKGRRYVDRLLKRSAKTCTNSKKGRLATVTK